MFFLLLATSFSLRIKKSRQSETYNDGNNVVIHGSTFQNTINNNKFANAERNLDKNINIGKHNSQLAIRSVDIALNNSIVSFNEPFSQTEIIFDTKRQCIIFNLTIQNARSTNGCGLFSFQSTIVEIEQLKFKGGLSNTTLFDGKVSSMILKNSDITNFDTSNIPIINLDQISVVDQQTVVQFVNNDFHGNNMPVFGLSTTLRYNVLISKNTFTKNTATNGSCIYISKFSNTKSNYKITIDNNTFSENENAASGNGYVCGAVIVTTEQALFTNDNYFYKNQVYYDDNAEESKAFGASIYLIQNRVSPFTLENIHFEGDYSSGDAGSLFIYGRDEPTASRTNVVNVDHCTFVNSNADFYGGSISTGLLRDGRVVGNNDILITNCTFTGCKAASGGAIYANEGTQKGGEQTEIIECIFENCEGSYGNVNW